MNASTARLRGDITAALARYEQWEQPLRKYRGRNTGRLNRGGFTWNDFDRELRELEAALCADFDPRSELHPLFEQLCTEYVASDDVGRARIRAFAAKQQKLGGLLWRYANSLTQRIADAEDGPLAAEALVARALAAVSIENCASDVRDTLMTLADLFAAAENADVDPAPLFAAASDWSTDEFTPGGCESLAKMLREFHGCSVLHERRGMSAPYGGPT